MARTYEIVFKVGATMATNFAKIMGSASGALGELNNRMDALGKQKSANQKVLELRDGLAKSSREFKEAQQRAAQLAAEIARTEKPTKSMQREFDKAQAAVQKSRDKMQQQAATLREVSKEAGATGKSTAQLVAEQNRLAQAGDRASKAQQALQRNVAAQQANVAKRGELRGQLFDAVGLAATLGAPAKMAAEWEQQLAEFNKVASLSKEELAGISTAAQETAVATGVAREGIMGAYIAAAQAGFARDEWEKFAIVSAKMGIAFDTTGEDAGEMLKAWRSSMGLTMDQAEELAAAANHLANNMNATASDVGQVLQRQGAVLKAAGLSDTQGAALAASMLSGGAAAEVAATASKNFVRALTAGGAASKTQKAALEAIGFHDPERLAKAMQVAPEKAIMMVLERLQGVEAHKQMAVMTQLFGSESVGGIAPLIANLDNLAGAFELVRNKSDYADSLEQEFEAMGSTTKNQAKKAAEGLKMMATTVGSILLPPINQFLATMAPLAMQLAKFAQENQKVTTAIVATVAAFMAIKIAAIAGGYAFTFVKGAVLAVRGAYLSAKTALLLYNGAMQVTSKTSKSAVAVSKLMTAAQWLFNAALTANPIGLVIVAIAGLIAAGVALYKYWDVVVAFLKGAWQGLIAGLAPLKESFSGLAPIMDLIRAAVGWVSDAFATLVGWFKKTETDSAALETAASYGQKFGEIMALGIEVATWPLRQLINLIGWAIENIPKLPEAIMGGVDSIKNFLANFSLFDSGKAMLNTLADGIKSAVSVPVDAVKGALSKVREYLPFSDAKVGPLSELTASGTAIMSTLSEGMTKFNAANFGEAFMAIPGKLTGAVDTLMGGSGGGGSAGGSAPVIHLTQQITVSGGGSVYEDAKRGASAGGEELVKQLDRALSLERRLSFG